MNARLTNPLVVPATDLAASVSLYVAVGFQVVNGGLTQCDLRRGRQELRIEALHRPTDVQMDVDDLQHVVNSAVAAGGRLLDSDPSGRTVILDGAGNSLVLRQTGGQS